MLTACLRAMSDVAGGVGERRSAQGDGHPSSTSLKVGVDVPNLL